LALAQERGLDLVEVAPQAKPPVCRIIDYGKYLYQQAKKEKEQRTKQKQIEIKGIRISPRTSQHDLETKAKQVEKFLNQGNKVKIEIILRGREKSFQFRDFTKEKLEEFIKLIPVDIVIERETKKEGRGLNIVISKK
jgi:translation initiation factor IF-3